tara:strand:+ start:193 stop:1056 length:864 start_codon:yes stop_codon:yes gene_type:complete
MNDSLIKKINDLPKISEVIKSYNLSAKRRLSQNYILDLNLTNHIVKISGDIKNKNVIEVGPGPGSLTRAILTAGAKRVIAIEKDVRFIDALKILKKIVGIKLTLINEDALKINLKEIMRNNSIDDAVIISNLPYSIATRLLIQWLPFPENINKMTLMFQREVAERIIAKVGTKQYGRLSVITNIYGNSKILMNIPSKVFFPKPKVNSSIIQIVPKSQIMDNLQKNNLEKVTQALFHQRRKKIKSSLRYLGDPDKLCKLANIDPSLRAEQITPNDFAKLSNIAFPNQN